MKSALVCATCVTAIWMTPARGQPEEVVFASTPFSKSADSIAPKTRGIEVAATLRSAAAVAAMSKGEYETHAEFALRRRVALERALKGVVPVGKPFAVIHPLNAFPLRELAPVQVEYSAETEVLALRFNTTIDCMMLASSTRPTGSYVGTSIQGIKAGVATVERHETCVGVGEDSKVLKGLSSSLEFPIPRSQAKSAKAELAIAFIGVITDPFVRTEKFHRRPTLRSPLDMVEVRDSLMMNLEDVWVIHTPTGKVLAKLDGEFSNAAPRLAQSFATSFSGDCTYPEYRKSELPNFNLVVTMAVPILSDGRVGKGAVIESTGNGDLDGRALEALSKCAFKPGRKNGVTYDGEAIVKFHFGPDRAKNY